MTRKLNVPASAFRPMAARMDNAVRHLVETLAAAGGLVEDDARKVAGFYIKHKLVKSDFAIGRYQFKHGAYLERDVIRNALAQA